MPELDDIRQRLEARLATLQSRVARIEGHLRTPGDRDWQEKATEAENDEVLERLGEAERSELEEIRSALGRIAAGTYGRCTRCGEPIGAGRLEALRYATLCISCAD